MGRIVELRAGAREPQVGDRLAWDGVGWVPEVNIARPRGMTHVHTDTVVRVVMGPWRSPDFVTGSSGWQIDADGSAEFNDITARGTITATAGEIGGWTIEAGHLYAGSGANRVGLKPGTYPFYAGAEAEGSAPFRVNTAGEMWATNAHIAGEIDANSGHLGTLDIDGVLTVGTGTPVIQVDGPNKRIRTSDFVSGQKGWEITHEGNAEFNNLFVRGELHATVFVADEMHATGGTLAVMTAAKVAEPIVSTDNKLLGSVGNQFVLVVQASWDTGLCYLADDDVLRIKTMAEVSAGGSLDLWDIWLEVYGVPTSNSDRDLANGKPGTHDVNCLWRQGGQADLVIPTGAAVVRWGHIGTEKGGLILTSDLNYSPYMDIFTIPSATPWSSGTTPHVRVGNLDGVLSLGEEWGIAAGKDLSDAAEPHIVMSDQRLRLWGVEQRWWDTSGNLRGEVDPSAGSSDVLFWLGPSEAGAHFKVLGSGDVWLDTLAISGNLGDFLFSKADGLLLLGPNCEINDGEWWSLRRQKATITGAFHQEAGRWLGTRGLVVEPGAANLIINPSCETGIIAHVAHNGTTTHSSSQARFGSYSCKLTTTGANAYVTYREGGAGGFTSVVSGVAHALSWWIHADTGGDAIVLRWWEYDAGGGWLGESTTSQAYTLKAGWQKLSVVSTTRATCTKIRPVIQNMDNGHIYYLDGLNLVQSTFTTTHIDGDQGHEYTWSGAVHASTSTRVATRVTIPSAGAIDMTSAGTLILWVRPVWNGNDNIRHDLFGVGPTNDRFALRKHSDNTLMVDLYSGGAGQSSINPSVASWAKDEWHCIIFTWATNDLNLYIDGDLVGADTSATLPTTTSGDVRLGELSSWAYYPSATYGEIATFTKALSVSVVAAIYALQRPLVDAGAMDSPGIYILDGRFRMASSLTGNRIEMTAEEIAGYDSGGTKQFYLRASDGKAYTAGGKFVMEQTGIWMEATTSVQDQRKFRFLYDSSGTLYPVGQITGSYGIAESESFMWVVAKRTAGAPWGTGARVIMDAYDYVASKEAFVDLMSALEAVSIGDNLVVGNAALAASGDFGGGHGVVSVRNASTVPTSNPSWGGLMYSQGGAGKWRSSGGTITTFGPADPHCPRCGRDFVLEWENEEQGTHLQVCMWCLAEALGVRMDTPFVLKKVGPAVVRRSTRSSISPPPTRSQIEAEVRR